MRILCYAINHVGLGHVVRLSVIQRYVTERQLAECYFFSESPHAASFFTCPGVVVDADNVGPRERWRLVEAGLRHAIREVQPDVLLCDTYWSEAASSLPSFRRQGGRAVLVQRLSDVALMRTMFRRAFEVFDNVLVPHHPEEVRRVYRGAPDVLRQLDSPRVGFVGPVCRTAPRVATVKNTIFSIGAGGERPGDAHLNTVETLVRVYIEASRLLRRRGRMKPTLAAGPFLESTAEIEENFEVCRTSTLYERFGPNATVVTRGGYNTVWEAIAARSRLVVCGSRDKWDDVKGRGAFILNEGLGRAVRPHGRMLFERIVSPWDEQRVALDRWASIVNAGLDLTVDEILGSGFLRARERPGDYRRARIMNRKRKRLIARFEDVDPRHPSPELRSAVRAALKHGYHAQMCLTDEADAVPSRSLRALEKRGAVLVPAGSANASAGDFVRVLAWPGPRVRSELRIAEELAKKSAGGVNTGIAIHAERVPLFLTEYLLRLFSLHNG